MPKGLSKYFARRSLFGLVGLGEKGLFVSLESVFELPIVSFGLPGPVDRCVLRSDFEMRDGNMLAGVSAFFFFFFLYKELVAGGVEFRDALSMDFLR